MTPHRIVLHGATGFTGKFIADYLARHPEGCRFSRAIGGRNPDKLSRVRDCAPLDLGVQLVIERLSAKGDGCGRPKLCSRDLQARSAVVVNGGRLDVGSGFSLFTADSGVTAKVPVDR